MPAKAIVIRELRGFYGTDDWSEGKILETDPNGFDVDPDEYFGGFGAEEDLQALRARWASDVEAPARAIGLRPPRLLLLRAEYRRMYEPLLSLIRELEREFPERTIAGARSRRGARIEPVSRRHRD